ncbi:hypothetical protein PC116_g20701 [Phytophthora cactorum]|nr:hypothetical protein PC114_g18406 [Phytophthora cactorum]KAG4231018.1 hypothetical protein PC116_g20701 [Phytophthora cactorum]
MKCLGMPESRVTSQVFVSSRIGNDDDGISVVQECVRESTPDGLSLVLDTGERVGGGDVTMRGDVRPIAHRGLEGGRSRSSSIPRQVRADPHSGERALLVVVNVDRSCA